MAETDLIRRSEAIEVIENTDWYHQNDNGDMVSGAENEHEAWYKAEDVYNALESVSSAQSERKTGHWIVNVEKENTISGSCSACGWQAHLHEDDVVGMNFCPNCGARMKGADDE